jgi:hypothetical protein
LTKRPMSVRTARRSYKVAARTTADKIASNIGSQLRSKTIDLSDLRAAKDVFEEAQIGADGLKKLYRRGTTAATQSIFLRKDLRPSLANNSAR